jgi:hypothetical protein
MKVGDLVRKKGNSQLIGLVSGVKKRAIFGRVVEVVWPGCKGFWTDENTLEVVNENR